jgi:hypothetical protein
MDPLSGSQHGRLARSIVHREIGSYEVSDDAGAGRWEVIVQ